MSTWIYCLWGPFILQTDLSEWGPHGLGKGRLDSAVIRSSNWEAHFCYYIADLVRQYADVKNQQTRIEDPPSLQQLIRTMSILTGLTFIFIWRG